MAKKAIMVFMMFAVGFAVFGMTAPDVQARTINLTYANFFPPTHFNAILQVSWAEEIEKRTNGRVKFTHFPGGALVGGAEMFDGVQRGIADVGMSLFAYTAGRFPVMEALDLPMGYPTGYAATMVANDYYNEFKPQELEGVKLLYLHAHGPGLLHSKVAVRKLEDMRGLKVRSTGFSARAATALGAVPVAMPQGGAYEALQRGVVEASLAPIEVLKGWNQAEVIDYTTECFSVGYTTTMFVIMNERKWNELPDDIKAIFEEVSKEWIKKHAQGWDDADREGREFSLSLGNELIPLSDEEQARWAENVRPVIDDFAGELKARGLPGDEYIDFILHHIEKYSE